MGENKMVELIALVAPILVFAATVGTWIVSRRKNAADAQKILEERKEIAVRASESAIEAVLLTIDPLKQSLREVQARVTELEVINARLETENAQVTKELAQLKQLVHGAVNSLRLYNVVRNVSDAVLIEDPDRRVALANKAFTMLFDIPTEPETLVGKDCHAVAQILAPHVGDITPFQARVNALIEEWEDVYNEPITLTDGTKLERTFLALTHGSGKKEAAWIYRRK